MRIVYCIDSINGIGGIQRVTVTKANALAAISGNAVWVIVADESGKRLFPLSSAIHFINLSVNYYEDDWKSKWNVLKGILIKRRIHRRRLEKELRRISPDVVVSVGQSEKNFLPRIKGNWCTIREFHFTRDYRRRLAKDMFGKASAVFGDLFERWFSLRLYDRLVVLTHEEQEANWKGNDKVSVIPNPVTFYSAKAASADSKKVIAVGRLSYQKNFASLIRTFAEVANRHSDWNLDIFGDGPEKRYLQEEIDRLSLQDQVFLHGSLINVQKRMSESSVIVVTSRFEGFSLVLVEAMSCGLPAVSYTCPCGPKDIITDGVNGFLVPEGNEEMLAERICRLIENEELRKRMGSAALERSKDFSMEKITQMWMDLFEELLRQKQ